MNLLIKLCLTGLLVVMGLAVISSTPPAFSSSLPGEPPLIMIRDWKLQRNGTLVAKLSNGILLRFQILFSNPAPECVPVRTKDNKMYWTTPGENSFRYVTSHIPFAYKEGGRSWQTLIKKTYER